MDSFLSKYLAKQKYPEILQAAHLNQVNQEFKAEFLELTRVYQNHREDPLYRVLSCMGLGPITSHELALKWADREVIEHPGILVLQIILYIQQAPSMNYEQFQELYQKWLSSLGNHLELMKGQDELQFRLINLLVAWVGKFDEYELMKDLSRMSSGSSKPDFDSLINRWNRGPKYLQDSLQLILMRIPDYQKVQYWIKINNNST